VQRCPFRALFPDASAAAIELMEAMLQFNPARRITVEQALAHPYLAQIHDPASELAAPSAPLLLPACSAPLLDVLVLPCLQTAADGKVKRQDKTLPVLKQGALTSAEGRLARIVCLIRLACGALGKQAARGAA
jgi:serine/threonine protein kinase